LLESFDNGYEIAGEEIGKKFAELKNKILINFKEAYWKKDIFLIKVIVN
jgi:hypothetical protein